MFKSSSAFFCLLGLVVLSQGFKVKLAGLFPSANILQNDNPGLWHLGREVRSAFLIACDHVNRDILQDLNTEFECLAGDLGEDKDQAVSIAKSLSDQGAVGFVGALRSSFSIAIADGVSEVAKKPQISYASTSELLSDKTQFPFFFRTVPPDSFQALALVDLIKKNRFTKVATISTDDQYAAGIANTFERNLNGLILTASKRFPIHTNDLEVVRPLLQSIKESGARCIVLSGIGDDISVVFDVAFDLGMVGDGWTWFGPDGVASVTVDALAAHPKALQGLQGFIATRPKGGFGKLFEDLRADWIERNETLFPGSVHQGLPPTIFTGETYDAVYAFAYALHAVEAAGGNVTDGTVLRDALFRVDFQGTTGRVRFAANGDPYGAVYDVVNFRGGVWYPVGAWSTDGYQSKSIIQWPGGRVTPAVDLDESDCDDFVVRKNGRTYMSIDGSLSNVVFPNSQALLVNGRDVLAELDALKARLAKP